MKKKIKKLFDYRGLPELMKVGKVKGKKKLYKRLLKLQISIYKLDEYLESNWKTYDRDLLSYWNCIHQCMLDCGVPKSKLPEYSKHILKYQKHELNLRISKLPIDGSIEYYYYYKSCDVRLMRQIIYDHSEQLEETYNMADWRYFDLITEVNDDAEDLEEDLNTINGNYILIASWFYGRKQAEKIMSQFIDVLKIKNDERYENRKSVSNYKLIHKQTNIQLEATRALLKKNLKMVSKKKIKKAKLFKYLSD